ncbi:hypothetical protein [Legionella micdadei]|uniref:Substrate of the Dot/Icm secretion system n=1 Tax=Legionella micdadei TaxID=451 RepID=A0A098GJC4_LEGMI|nr:hypothetical protein [Legionella micdadei]ARG98545.1 hypothetical protein B6N58_13265 [Legionella micdadei]KTD27405.1 substrate of the Dot/Icm secretion system [Legionella micdadei]NSL19385.1 hypothetical protein [Legionella micdadei]CEG62112.1 protein of unknown function [Legionella micdadei]SCY74280.1 hypothetical protein SAMN02982997_02746 [Legionella micdadei]
MPRATLRTTTRGTGIKPLAPESKAIDAAKECVRHSPEGADYLVDRFDNRMDELGMTEEAKGMRRHLEDFREYVHMKSATNGQAWFGEFVEGNYKNLQRNIADKAAKEVAENIQGPIRVDFAVDENSHYKRVFVNEGQKISGEQARPLDKLVNAFFGENDIANRGNILYEATKEGDMKYERGEPKRADPEEVDSLMKTELKDYLGEHGIEADVRSRSGQAKQQPQKAAQQVTGRAAAVKEAPAPGTPTPSSGDEAPTSAPAA